MNTNLELKVISIYLAIAVFMLLILPWNGFYLLNDSYVYEWNVKNFFSSNLHLHPLTSPTLLYQTFIGALTYTIKQDPSYLRLLTLTHALMGVYFFYKILKDFGLKTKNALLTSLVLFFNPLYIYLALTFMSDIYFLSMFIASSFFIQRYAVNRKKSYLLVVVVTSTLAFLSRQHALVLIVIQLSGLSYLNYRKNNKFIFKEMLYFMLPLLAFAWYQFFYAKPLGYTSQSIELTLNRLLRPSFLVIIFDRLIKTLYYLGFFTIPITFAIAAQKKLEILKSFSVRKMLTRFWGVTTISFVILTIISAYLWFYDLNLMFYLPNIMSYAGFQPQNLQFGIKQDTFVNYPVRIRAFITLLSITSTSILFGLFAESYSKRNINNVFYNKYFVFVLFIALPILGIFFLTLIFRAYYDRYILVLAPLLILMLIRSIRKLKHQYLLFVVILWGLYSLALSYDYLSFNKTAWELPNKYSLTPKEYKGTFEYNAYYRLDNIKDANTNDIFNRSTWVPDNSSYNYFLSYSNVIDYCEYVNNLNYKTPLSTNAFVTLKILKHCQ